MKKYIYAIIIVCAAVALGTIVLLLYDVSKLKKENERLQQTNTAYNINLKNEKGKSAVYAMTIKELENSNDSLLKVAQKIARKQGAKKKATEYVGYTTGKASKTDTIYLKQDTIKDIVRDSVKIDTVISDLWYKLKVHLESPNQLVVSPEFKSERLVSVYTKKEYKNKRSKVFFIRWFQKKINVTYVSVEEKNPYIDVQQQKLVKVVK